MLALFSLIEHFWAIYVELLLRLFRKKSRFQDIPPLPCGSLHSSTQIHYFRFPCFTNNATTQRLYSTEQTATAALHLSHLSIGAYMGYVREPRTYDRVRREINTVITSFLLLAFSHGFCFSPVVFFAVNLYNGRVQFGSLRRLILRANGCETIIICKILLLLHPDGDGVMERTVYTRTTGIQRAALLVFQGTENI